MASCNANLDQSQLCEMNRHHPSATVSRRCELQERLQTPGYVFLSYVFFFLKAEDAIGVMMRTNHNPHQQFGTSAFRFQGRAGFAKGGIRVRTRIEFVSAIGGLCCDWWHVIFRCSSYRLPVVRLGILRRGTELTARGTSGSITSRQFAQTQQHATCFGLAFGIQ